MRATTWSWSAAGSAACRRRISIARRIRSARILILENHDDFGGHAKRNEFHVGGRMELHQWRHAGDRQPDALCPVAGGLLKTLGIDPVALTQGMRRPEALSSRWGSTPACSSTRRRSAPTGSSAPARAKRNFPPGTLKPFLAKTPLSDEVRQRHRAHRRRQGGLHPGLTSDQKKDKLWRLCYAIICCIS